MATKSGWTLVQAHIQGDSKIAQSPSVGKVAQRTCVTKVAQRPCSSKVTQRPCVSKAAQKTMCKSSSTKTTQSWIRVGTKHHDGKVAYTPN